MVLNFIISADSELMSLRKILDDANSTDEELNDAYDRMNGIEGYSMISRGRYSLVSDLRLAG